MVETPKESYERFQKVNLEKGKFLSGCESIQGKGLIADQQDSKPQPRKGLCRSGGFCSSVFRRGEGPCARGEGGRA